METATLAGITKKKLSVLDVAKQSEEKLLYVPSVPVLIVGVGVGQNLQPLPDDDLCFGCVDTSRVSNSQSQSRCAKESMCTKRG